jgi:hypothetical protein
MKTIFADFNAMTEADKARLDCRGSREDIQRAGVQPGNWIWLSDGEVLVGARLEVDPYYGLVGVPAWETLVHLDDLVPPDFPQLWSELQDLLRHPGGSTDSELRVFQLLTILEQLAPPEFRAAIPPGYLALRRAGALYFLGHSGMALHEVEVALSDRPDDPDLVYFYLELLLRQNPGRAALEAEAYAERPDVAAPVLAACIDIETARAEQVQDEAFRPIGRQVLQWADQFERAPGRERVRADILASVQFNRGLILLRLGEIGEAQAALRLAHVTEPNQQVYDDASRLGAFDNEARRIAARFRERPLPLPMAA